jgi:hypothetical protein
MEAKSDKGAGNFDEIEIQTAHPIVNLLVLQHELHNTEFDKIPIPRGPPPWSFANVGEIWRVLKCYVASSGDIS